MTKNCTIETHITRAKILVILTKGAQNHRFRIVMHLCFSRSTRYLPCSWIQSHSLAFHFSGYRGACTIWNTCIQLDNMPTECLWVFEVCKWKVQNLPPCRTSVIFYTNWCKNVSNWLKSLPCYYSFVVFEVFIFILFLSLIIFWLKISPLLLQFCCVWGFYFHSIPFSNIALVLFLLYI